MLVPHIPVVVATIVLFLSQIAILAASISFEKARAVPEEYVHTKHDQQRRGSEDQVS
jgi:hypothetical protein